MLKYFRDPLYISSACVVSLMVAFLFSFLLFVQTNQELKDCKKMLDIQQEELYNKDALLDQDKKEMGILQKQNADLRKQIQELESSRRISCEVSAYSVGDGATPSNVMASGRVPYVGAVACNFLPIGTQVRIDGNIYTVEDRCGIDNCIDIYMETHHECIQFGRKVMEVEIL